jgi:cytochrome c oxidase cbb3-type subunit III
MKRCSRATCAVRTEAVLVAGMAMLALSSCQREYRELQPAPADRALVETVATTSFRPGGVSTPPAVGNPYHGNAFAISEGKRLYNWYNCSGCHFQGSGGIGPALMDDEWIYGSEPAQIYDTILRGRPNGMPAWAGKIPEYQMWQIVAYVRSLGGLEPQAASPSRSDTMQKSGGTPAAPAEPPPGDRRPPQKP